MKILVQKYGGSSVNNVANIHNVVNKINTSVELGYKVIVVVSAAYGETNRLHDLAKAITLTPNVRELDVLLACGEQISIALLTMALQVKQITACSFTGQQAGIITDACYGRANILNVDVAKIKRYLQDVSVIVVAGFQGVSNTGDITTLGRGGSDLTAVVLAHFLQAAECQIYGDVAGIYTADPYMVVGAKLLPHIDGKFMVALMHMGARVLQTQAANYAYTHKVPVCLLSSFEQGNGTKVVYDRELDGFSVSICQDLIALEEQELPLVNLEHVVVGNFYVLRKRDLPYALELLPLKNPIKIDNLALISLINPHLDISIAQTIMNLFIAQGIRVLAHGNITLKVFWLLDDKDVGIALKLVHNHVSCRIDTMVI